MKISYPGSDVAFCTGFWIVLGAFCIGVGISRGDMPWTWIVAIHIAVIGLGMWFRIRSAGYTFGAINLFLGVIGLLGLILMGGFSTKLCARIVGNFYAAWASVEWARKLDEQ